MSQETSIIQGEPVEYEIPRPDISHLITEDDTPVDNIFSEKQMRLLADSLYSGWSGPGEGGPFLVATDVALYYALHTPALVPDLLLSLGVAPPEDPKPKENRSYFVWEYGKAPDLVVEIVSNRKGGELGNKLLDYARAGVSYYVVFDPFLELGDEKLRLFARRGGSFREIEDRWLEEIELGLTLWEGDFENWSNVLWLRWVDRDGNLIPTGAEAKAQANQRAEEAVQRAEEAVQRAEAERVQREDLLAKLRAAGIDPDKL